MDVRLAVPEPRAGAAVRFGLEQILEGNDLRGDRLAGAHGLDAHLGEEGAEALRQVVQGDAGGEDVLFEES